MKDDHFRKLQGCDGAGAEPVAFLPDGSPLYECPGRLVTATTMVALEMFPSWEKGRGIFAPCAMDEPAVLVDAMKIVGAEIARRQSEEMNRGG